MHNVVYQRRRRQLHGRMLGVEYGIVTVDVAVVTVIAIGIVIRIGIRIGIGMGIGT
jgi:hypothetical protein